MNTSSSASRNNLPVAAVAIAGWVVPGLAHFLIGQRQRGLIVGITLLSLFSAGVLVGGIDVIDHRNDTLWFAGQALIGPLAPAIDILHAHYDKNGPPSPPRPGYTPPYEISVGRVNELGTLYCTLAGVLNLLVILNAIGRCQAQAQEPTAEDVP